MKTQTNLQSLTIYAYNNDEVDVNTVKDTFSELPKLEELHYPFFSNEKFNFQQFLEILPKSIKILDLASSSFNISNPKCFQKLPNLQCLLLDESMLNQVKFPKTVKKIKSHHPYDLNIDCLCYMFNDFTFSKDGDTSIKIENEFILKEIDTKKVKEITVVCRIIKPKLYASLKNLTSISLYDINVNRGKEFISILSKFTHLRKLELKNALFYDGMRIISIYELFSVFNKLILLENIYISYQNLTNKEIKTFFQQLKYLPMLNQITFDVSNKIDSSMINTEFNLLPNLRGFSFSNGKKIYQKFKKCIVYE